MEIWKPIIGYEGYEISTLGRVKSFKRSCEGRILKPRAFMGQYLCVEIQVFGKRKTLSVHRLVAEVFIPNPEGKPQVNHINGIKTDNRVENLEWCTCAENRKHAYDTGLAPSGEAHYKAKLTNDQALYIRENPTDLSCKELAEIFNVTSTTVSLIQRGKTFRNIGGDVRASKTNRHYVSDNDRAEINRLYIKGSREFGCRGLAKKFGIDPTTVSRIVRKCYR